MRKRHITLIGALAGLSIMFLGCAGNLPGPERVDVYDMNQGRPVEMAKNQQILNPEAGKVPTPVVGLDGVAANDQMEKYRGALKEREKVTQTVGVGLQVTPMGIQSGPAR